MARLGKWFIWVWISSTSSLINESFSSAILCLACLQHDDISSQLEPSQFSTGYTRLSEAQIGFLLVSVHDEVSVQSCGDRL